MLKYCNLSIEWLYVDVFTHDGIGQQAKGSGRFLNRLAGFGCGDQAFFAAEAGVFSAQVAQHFDLR